MSWDKECQQQMEKAIEHYKDELRNIRTGRAHPSMVEGVQVEVYGTQMRLKDLASINSPESRQLVITPFDMNNLGGIAKGIEKANLGFTPVVEGNLVRITIPPMDEGMRKEMVKIVSKRQEEAKISIRNVRRDSNEKVRGMKNDGEMTEDQEKGAEKKIQEYTDRFCKQIEEMASSKEKEVMTI